MSITMRNAALAVVAVTLCGLAMADSTDTNEPSADQAAGPVKVNRAERFGTARTVQELMQQPRSPIADGGDREVVNRVPQQLAAREPVATSADPVARGFISRQAPAATLSFGGYDSDDNATLFGFRIMPPDTQGDVGLNYYVQYNNLGWKYFNKSDGSLAGGPFPGNIFWQGFGGVCESDNAGDPIVLYDQFADRWVFSQFTDPGNPDGHQCFAVTQGNNPAGPYYLYDFVVSPGQFNDYEKITVWTDGAGQSAYHMSSNEFAASFVGVNATAFDRDKMLNGDPTADFIQFSLPTATGALTNFSLQPSHLEGPNAVPAGTCNEYIMAFDDQTWGTGGGPDGYRFWTFCADFTTPANSTFTAGPFVTSDGFDAELCGYGDCIPQPGTTQLLDTLGQFTMYRFSNRFFPGTGLRGVISHTVDSGGNLAGVRWTELDIDNHSILDSGTLAPGDGVSRWMPAVSMDGAGNIGMVYTKSSGTVRPSVYFTGRETTDPAGTLQSESVCIDGTGSQLGGVRWGDYATVSVDPVDDCTFWVTNEFVETTGSFQWDTQVCAFKFASCGVTPTCNNNGICESGEDCLGCAADCPSFDLPGANCGNGLCEAGDGETFFTCSADCAGKSNGKPSNRFACGFGDGLNPDGCGDSRCNSGGFSCTETPVGSGGTTCCGDLACEIPEDSFSCGLDCGAPPTCGDGTCDPTEDSCSCASDCGAPPATEAGLCSDGVDNDCNGAVDCDDGACDPDPACQAVDCSEFGNKRSCNAEPSCRWDNRNKVCLAR